MCTELVRGEQEILVDNLVGVGRDDCVVLPVKNLREIF